MTDKTKETSDEQETAIRRWERRLAERTDPVKTVDPATVAPSEPAEETGGEDGEQGIVEEAKEAILADAADKAPVQTPADGEVAQTREYFVAVIFEAEADDDTPIINADPAAVAMCLKGGQFSATMGQKTYRLTPSVQIPAVLQQLKSGMNPRLIKPGMN